MCVSLSLSLYIYIYMYMLIYVIALPRNVASWKPTVEQIRKSKGGRYVVRTAVVLVNIFVHKIRGSRFTDENRDSWTLCVFQMSSPN